MADFFPFQDVPGLLTPEMSNNVRTQSLLHAGAGLLTSAGWSDKPVNMWQALGAGLQGGLQGYEQGTNQAVKLTLLREQAEKLAEARRQAAQWASIFGVPGATQSAAMGNLPQPAAPSLPAPSAPTLAPPAVGTPTRISGYSDVPPAGLLNTGPIRTDGTAILGGGIPTPPADAPVPMPASPSGPPIPSSPKVWGDAEAVNAGLYDAPGKPPIAPAGPVIPAAKSAIPTQHDVRATANDGLRATIAAMPQGLREMIAIAGPEKGKEILAQWVGKKAEKPSDTFLTVEMPDGSTKPYRADAPELDNAIKAGGVIVTTPSSKSQNELVALQMPDGKVRTMRRADPAVDQLIANGAIEVTKPSTKGSNAIVALRMGDGSVKSFRSDDPQVDTLLSRGAVEVTKPSSDPKDHKPDNYALPDGRTVLSSDGKSYRDPRTNQVVDLPTDAVRLGAESGYEASRQNAVRGRAQTALDTPAAPGERPPAEAAVRKGTGTWSNLASAYNAVVGGVGLDAAFGKNGVFAQNEANRNYLLNIRQSAKTALVNNPRFPVAEQKNVDRMFPDPEKFWANPRTEADKIPLLRNTLEEQLRMNNEALAGGALAKEEISRLTTNNIETKRALRLLGHGDASLKALGDTPTAAADAPAPKATELPPVPNARKAPDGKWYMPDPDRPGKYLRVSGDFNERFAAAQ